jgi:hypothetical protein
MLKLFAFVAACHVPSGIRAQAVPSIEAEGQNVVVSAPGGVVSFDAQAVVIQGVTGGVNLDIGASISSMMSTNTLLTQQVASLATAASSAALTASSISTAQSSEIWSLQSQLAATDQRAVDADHTAVIGTLNTSLLALVNASTVGFNEIEARLNPLEDHIYNASMQRPIFGNINFEDGDGNQTNMIGFSPGGSMGNYQIMRLAPGDQPPGQQPPWAGGRNYTRAVRLGLGVTDRRVTEYELHTDAVQLDSPWHISTMCPGVYRMTAWARRSDDYNGAQMLFHSRFWYEDGSTTIFAHNQNDGAVIGAFPRSSEWQQVTGSLVVSRRASRLWTYLGYPTRNTRGWVDVTGFQILRLGGLGSC